jgi:hypothetical protein
VRAFQAKGKLQLRVVGRFGHKLFEEQTRLNVGVVLVLVALILSVMPCKRAADLA